MLVIEGSIGIQGPSNRCQPKSYTGHRVLLSTVNCLPILFFHSSEKKNDKPQWVTCSVSLGTAMSTCVVFSTQGFHQNQVLSSKHNIGEQLERVFHFQSDRLLMERAYPPTWRNVHGGTHCHWWERNWRWSSLFLPAHETGLRALWLSREGPVSISAICS